MVSNFELVIRLFEKSKMFYPPEGLCSAEPERGPIVFTLHFIGVGRGTEGFKFWAGNPPFWKVENVLSLGGTLQSRARRWSNCFYFRFYWFRKRYWGFQNPHIPSAFLKSRLCFIWWGWIIVFFYVLFGLGMVYWTFNLSPGNRLFKTFKMFYPPEEGCGSSSQGVQLFLLSILLV